jgi:activator of 2-hydroxyglutaryl-CoA dehydratase/predicted nucleotide-binding protein (sugar kinase/HSP70/actin superfamily)
LAETTETPIEVVHTRKEPVALGIDVGSTTVKAVVVDPVTKEILWSDYQRHQTKQAEFVLGFLERIQTAFPNVKESDMRLFITGSGGSPIGPHLGAKFVQEVNAVTLAVETLHPDVGSVCELGGQDAKIIIFKKNEETGQKTAITSMNDKCASGTGATIDKCVLKVNLPNEEVVKIQFDDSKLHHVAAKCGVFAETDIVNLVKSGIPSLEIMNSLADAIVMQNLSVLTRGNTLRHKVLLLGGPNTYLPFLRDCWRKRIPETWNDRGYAYPKDVPIEELIIVPENAQYYAAYGAVVYGLYEEASVGVYKGMAGLNEFIKHGRASRLGETAGPPLIKEMSELDEFRESYRIPKFEAIKFEKGQVVKAVIGMDGGSTSSKAVLIDYETGELLKKEYQLSKGNPIADTKEILGRLKDYVTSFGAELQVMGFGATGYAADVLQESVKSDVNIVETVAHMMSATHYFGDVDVICDIGGQDIKVLFMQNGDIKNFRLSNQCSAGNGMLLQAMADQFGVAVTDYADVAFGAKLSPKFSYGCAVFLDSDRVNFQKEGYSKEELLAGLAQVLPKNVWQYVVQIPRMAELGKKFVLQGGTQHNLAAVKAQVDYIKARVPGADVFVHPHTGEAGAIGAAFETRRIVRRKGFSTFIGIDQAINLQYVSVNDESTRCHFCPNNCARTFIDTVTPNGSTSRYISGFSCEKGTVESEEAMIALSKERKKIMKEFPNLVDYEAKLIYRHFYDSEPMPEATQIIDDVEVTKTILGTVKKKPVKRAFQRSSPEKWEARARVRVGIPKALNVWVIAPFMRTYLEALGIQKQHVVFSDYTSEELWLEGGKYGSIDPCYPSKVAQAHIHNLMFHHHDDGKSTAVVAEDAVARTEGVGVSKGGARGKKLNYIWFPCITHMPPGLNKVMDTASCPIVAGAPEVMKAAFTKETNFFAERGIKYVDPAITFTEMSLLKSQLFECFGPELGITEDESDFAVIQGMKAMARVDEDLQKKGQAILEQVEEENRVAVLMLGRPYHADPGLNHGVLEEFQVLGYPIVSMRSIPKDPKWLHRFFAEDIKKGLIETPLEVNDVWPENYSSNSVQKVWSAKFAARHPNVVVLDLSSFKCGHDAPTYGLIDSIISTSATPYSALHDVDANKPGGSIKIRVKTYAHSLKLHEERLDDIAVRTEQLQFRMEEKRLQLLHLKKEQLIERSQQDPALEKMITDVKDKVTAYAAKIAARKPVVLTPEELKKVELDKAKEAGLVRLGIMKRQGGDGEGQIARV